MLRRILAIILLLFATVLLIGVGALLSITPVGAHVLSSFGPPTPTPVPILTVQGTPPAIGAKAAYLLDADTGHTLVNINGQQRLPMASTTKIMTALITLQTADLNQVVTIKQDAINEVKKNQGSSAQLVVGDKIRLADLLYALMLPSGDDAAITIADTVAGSSVQFVDMMNQYAQRLHLRQTHYINPDGLTYMTVQGKPDPNHYTSAADLAQLTRIALSNPLFAQIVQLQEYKLPATAYHHAYDWMTTDTLLSRYPGAIGVKTGFTPEAGYCLVFSATDGEHHLIGVVLNDSATDPNVRFTDARKLLDWGFALPLRPPPASQT
ncbi:MAG: D-alanyl-D-alanine carboxypeptidase [Ktedonobacteraceae bacterium]|nr:D-alanyl-D-alanine carboxypeptidase [Ktedonobacteraceae bacterium]MBV9709731.1 D-alanyl-D-alanine carboxypeptidase [Ktedonobacteraceae bacterium]